jgi:DNA-binding PadR family transcriptional regulator
MSTSPNATAGSILGLLSRKPMTGWELYAAFEGAIGNFWSITRSQIYRELRSLEAAGLVEVGSAGKRERRACTITEQGRTAFSAWIGRMPGDESIRFPLLLTTFFGDSVPPETLKAACVEHRRFHAARLATYEAQLPEVRANEYFPSLALDFGMEYERAVLAWIDRLPWMQKNTGPHREPLVV